MFGNVKVHPSVVIVVAVEALFLYGLRGRFEDQQFYYSVDAIEKIKTDFLGFQFPAEYRDDRAFSMAAFDWRPPGFGIGFDGSVTDPEQNRYQVVEIEVPNGTEEMVIVYQMGNTAGDPLKYFSHFIIEHKPEDEYISPRRTIQLDHESIRFLSNGQEYKTHRIQSHDD